MKRIFISVITFLLSSHLCAQTSSQPKDVLKRISDYVRSQTSYQFYDSSAGIQLTDLDTNHVNPHAQFSSVFNDWIYPNGVTWYAMIRYGTADGFPQNAEYVLENFRCIFDHFTYFQKLWDSTHSTRMATNFRLHRMESLDDCGAMGAALIEAYNRTPHPAWRATINKIADYISLKQDRLPDGTLCRSRPRIPTVWGDDLYMSVPFLARMGTLTKNVRYYDDASKQVKQFYMHLLDPETKIAYHGYYDDIKRHSLAHWGRVNGWMMVATTELLAQLPVDYPERDSLIRILKTHIDGVKPLQDEQTGLWHQILDKSDSYLETSCTAMFTYSIARAVNEKWIDSSYANIAMKGWSGVASRITPEGWVTGTCRGTSMEDTWEFYYNRPAPTNDQHAFGPALLAAGEMMRMLQLAGR